MAVEGVAERGVAMPLDAAQDRLAEHLEALRWEVLATEEVRTAAGKRVLLSWGASSVFGGARWWNLSPQNVAFLVRLEESGAKACHATARAVGGSYGIFELDLGRNRGVAQRILEAFDPR